MHKEHKNTIIQNKLKQLKPRFGRLLWSLACKMERAILKRKGK